MATQTAPTVTPVVPLGTWTVDPDISDVAFEVRTMWGLAKVQGSFSRYRGNLVSHPHGAGGELVIDATSLDTSHDKRDKHLRSEDFFHVERHPEIVFTTVAITSNDGGPVVTGDLRIGTTSQRLRLPVEVEENHGRLRLRTSTVVSRESVGLSWNKLGMIRGDADLKLDLELTRES